MQKQPIYGPFVNRAEKRDAQHRRGSWKSVK